MITIATVADAFKTFYKPVIVDQMNTKVNPFMARIEKNSEEVFGSTIKMAMRYGVNGGVGNRAEDGDLPSPNNRKYKQAEYDTKNLFGTLRITEKSIRASANSAGAFTKLLETELDGLMQDAKINFGRQLFGNGTGKLATCSAHTSVNTITVDSVQYLIEGQVIDICDGTGTVKTAAREITSVDRTALTIIINGDAVTTLATDILAISGSYGLELTGLGSIFATSGSIYGLDRATYKWLIPTIMTTVGIISDIKIKKGFHTAEIVADSSPDFLLTSYGVERSYYEYLETTKRNVNTMKLTGGYTAISFDNKPLVSDKFCPASTMYLLNSADFILHQMGEWDFLDRDGSIFKQTANKAAWDAVLVKYGDLGCRKPIGQVQFTGITEDDGVA